MNLFLIIDHSKITATIVATSKGIGKTYISQCFMALKFLGSKRRLMYSLLRSVKAATSNNFYFCPLSASISSSHLHSRLYRFCSRSIDSERRTREGQKDCSSKKGFPPYQGFLRKRRQSQIFHLLNSTLLLKPFDNSPIPPIFLLFPFC